jgi:hypothetical protein
MPPPPSCDQRRRRTAASGRLWPPLQSQSRMATRKRVFCPLAKPTRLRIRSDLQVAYPAASAAVPAWDDFTISKSSHPTPLTASECGFALLITSPQVPPTLDFRPADTSDRLETSIPPTDATYWDGWSRVARAYARVRARLRPPDPTPAFRPPSDTPRAPVPRCDSAHPFPSTPVPRPPLWRLIKVAASP